MILYRALTLEDLKELKETGEINCTLYRSYNDLKHCKNSVMTQKMYQICYVEKNIKHILSFIYGHISGKLVNLAKRSPWISLTSDYEIAYKYSHFDDRYILCFKVDSDNIIKNIFDFETKNILKNAILKLSDGELMKYRDSGIIIPYCDDSNQNRNSKNFTFVNYSIADREYLKCFKLKPINYILLSPNNQEILNKKYGKNASQFIEKLFDSDGIKVKVKSK